MAKTRKNFKVSISKSLSEKNQKIFSKFRLAETFSTFSKYFQFNIEVNGISMYMQGI